MKPLWRRVLGIPDEAVGWWAVALATSMFALYAIFPVLARIDHGPAQHFLDRPLLAAAVILMAVCGIGGGLAAAVAIARRRDLSIFVWAALAVGILAAAFFTGEILIPH